MNKSEYDFIETCSGKALCFHEPSEDSINLYDIVTGLSQICRWNGQCKTFYNIAQHSINVYKIAKTMGWSVQVQLYCLLHDAAEAYIGDFSRPLKAFLPQIRDIEFKILRKIFKKLGISEPNTNQWSVVKFCDDLILNYEATLLMPCKVWTPDESLVKENENIIQKSQLKVGYTDPLNTQAEFISIFIELQNEYKKQKSDK